MINSTFQVLFKSFFHDKYTFEQFQNIDIKQEINLFDFNGTAVLNPSIKLRDFQKFISVALLNKLILNKRVCHSYQKDKNILTSLYLHKDSKYYLTTDIQNFFGSIQKKHIQQIIKSNLHNYTSTDAENYLESILNILVYDDKLPIGFLTSPILSNAFLYKLDNELEQYCINEKINYTRYADDLIFSSNDRESLLNLLEYLKIKINMNYDLKIKINTKKTKLVSKSSSVKILGLNITSDGYITIDTKMKKDIEVLFHFYKTNRNKYKDILNNKFEGRIGRVFGMMSYINGVDINFMNHLRKKYGNFIVDSFLHRSING